MRFPQALLDVVNLDMVDSEQWATLIGWPDMPDAPDMVSL